MGARALSTWYSIPFFFSFFSFLLVVGSERGSGGGLICGGSVDSFIDFFIYFPRVLLSLSLSLSLSSLSLYLFVLLPNFKIFFLMCVIHPSPPLFF